MTDKDNENQKTIKITLPVFNSKTVFKILAFICTFCVFMPSFLVSCSGQDLEISAFNVLTGVKMYDTQVVEPNVGILILIASSIATIVLLFIKKFDDVKTGLYTFLCKLVELISMIVFYVLVKQKTEENFCEFSVTPWYVIHIIVIILCILLSFCIFKQLISMSDDLFYRDTYKKIGSFLHGGLPNNTSDTNVTKSVKKEKQSSSSINQNTDIVTESLADKMHKVPKKYFVIIGVVAALVIGVTIYCLTPKTINLDNYILFETEGYDGYGTSSAYIDWESIENKYAKNIKYSNRAKSEAGNLLSLYSATEFCKDQVSVSKDKDNHLSNGDIVTVSINVTDDLNNYINCKFKYSSKTFTVSDLQEAKKIDLLCVLDEPYVSYKGPNTRTYASPKYKDTSDPVYTDDRIVVSISDNYGSKYISIVSNNQQIAKLEYAIDNEGPLSNNDEITLFLTNVDDLLANGYAPEKDNIRITVSDRPEIITDKDKMSKDSIEGYVIKYVYLKNLNYNYEPYSDNCYKNEVCHSAYIMRAKSTTITDYPVSILVDFSYEYTYPGFSRPWTTQYDGYIIMHNVYLEGNEMVAEDEDSGTYSYWSGKNIYELMDSYSSEYDFEQLF